MVQGKASADHTTLLLNCYTKLKDVDKLDRFLRGSGGPDSAPSLNFDVETAVKVGAAPSVHGLVGGLLTYLCQSGSHCSHTGSSCCGICTSCWVNIRLLISNEQFSQR